MREKFRYAGLNSPHAAYFLLLVLFLGCRNAPSLQRAAVTGRVTLDGQPLDAALIVFLPQGETRGPQAGGRVAKGAYELPTAQGPLVGEQRVEIWTDDSIASPAGETHGATAVLRERIPARYNRESTLAVTVARERPNQFDFDLTTAP